jgi:uncharacterized protein with HEPN domain
MTTYFLIHEYDSIDLDRVWETIQKDIAEFKLCMVGVNGLETVTVL